LGSRIVSFGQQLRYFFGQLNYLFWTANLFYWARLIIWAAKFINEQQLFSLLNFRSGMGNFEISGSNNLFRHEKIAS
jgi:hypothetical protein